MPTSLLAMSFPGGLLYAPPMAASPEPPMPSPARLCGGSLFPQEGCPLTRHGREGQDKDANDFGECVAGPVRPLVAAPIGPSLPHAHKAPAHKPTLAHRRQTGREIRITDARPNAVAPEMSAAAPFFAGLAIVHIIECALSSVVASKTGIVTMRVFLSLQHTRAMARIARSDWHFLDSTPTSTTMRTPAHIGGLALLSILPVLVSSLQLLVAVVEALVRTRLCTR